MSCKDCAERRRLAREALLNAKMGVAAGHVLKGVAEMAKLKPKTATKESKEVTKPNTGRKAKRK